MNNKVIDVAKKVTLPLRRARFAGSGSYWQNRYNAGGNSGAGSYGEFATFKAEVLNSFVADQGVTSVIEFGCGDGNQLTLAKYPEYVGLDIATGAIARCIAEFGGDSTKSFYLYSTGHFLDHRGAFRADLSMSLDVLFHLIEDEVFERYLRDLFASAKRYVVIYSSDENIPDLAAHVKHRRFSPWVAENIAGWREMKRVSNPVEGAVAHFVFYEKRA